MPVATVIGRYRYGRLPARLAAAALLLGAAAACAAISLPRRGAASVWSWGGFAVSLVLGVLYATRALRIGVTVTDRWLEQRRLLTSWRLDWSSIDGVAADERWFLIRSSDRTHLHETPRTTLGASLPFAACLASASGRPVGPVRLYPPVKPSEERLLRNPPTWPAKAVALLALGMWCNLAWLSSATADRGWYTARAARDVFTSADVVGWHVGTHGDGYLLWTDVRVVFPSEFGEIRTDLSRLGEDRDEREVIAIRYDPDNPRDADFVDGPAREAELIGTETERSFGKLGLAACAIAISVLGIRWFSVRSGHGRLRLHRRHPRRPRHPHHDGPAEEAQRPVPRPHDGAARSVSPSG